MITLLCSTVQVNILTEMAQKRKKRKTRRNCRQRERERERGSEKEKDEVQNLDKRRGFNTRDG